MGPLKNKIGGTDRLQDRLSSSKINSQTQMKTLCHLLLFDVVENVVFTVIYLQLKQNKRRLQNEIGNLRVTPPIPNSN